MKEKSKLIREVIATVFSEINSKNESAGINAMYKYKSQPIKENVNKEGENPKEETVGWEFSILVKELGYPDKEIQTFKFQKPNNIDRYTMEYHVILTVLSSLTETALITWKQIGEDLNTDKDFQKEAIKSLKDGKKINRNTDK